MNSKVINVTPKMAEIWLEQNVHNNRPVRDAEVTKFARDMVAGNWKVTHQGIAFNEDGKLIDGQHRLWAVVQSGCTVPMLVWEGLPEEALHLIDSGLARTASDSLGFLTDDHAYTNPKVIAAFRHILKTSLNFPQKYKFTATELYDYMRKYDNIVHAIYWLVCHDHAFVASAGYFSGLMFAVANDEPLEAVKAFDTMVVKGTATPGDYNYQAGVRFRFWYSGNDRPAGIGKAGPVTEYTTRCIYCFIHNKQSTKFSRYGMTAEKLQHLEEIFKDRRWA